ncbi:SDR family NAD(P)-dependent oxidoreductase [Leptolyngbya iicbica]|uniref:SDR family oxidoreductase n=2 Tax=Cyanophyceae TaxID=3028117 RepID=A0A4Q7E9G0_9CYAN|nr:SDR family oxidoreductase [Leptolyngbya sp. LK]RZM79487.1 SDR family oxidoreductase [Leptolyngbya sp. LK]
MTTALITGASGGIGAVFAEQLAARGYDLVLVARSQDKLQAIADQLAAAHGIQATVIVQDLLANGAADHLFNQLEQQGIEVDLLVNNAGFGAYGEVADGDRQTYLDMIQLNVSVLVDLTHRALQGMKQRRSGSILNISSIAAFQPMPYLAVYAASKSFVLSFSEALWYECQPYGIKVLGVCPGPTETQFFETADFPDTLAASGQSLDSPEAVVKEALRALDQGHSNVVTGGFSNQLVVNSSRFLPREVLTKFVGKMFSNEK